jgi:ketosteroid isomerase-like protein
MTRSIVAAIVLIMTAATAAMQSRQEAAMWSWVDRYYADYAAMSAAPTGSAMDRWLAHFAPDAFFEDPTAGLSGTGHAPIRKAYVEAFTGPLGPVRWTILRRAISDEWAVVEGWVDGSRTGKPIRARFTTWLNIRGGKIVHQIDYLDYAAFNAAAGKRKEGGSQ